MSNDMVRIMHMHDASKEIVDFTKGKEREDLDQDRKLNLSLVHLLEIIGEAAAGVSEETKKEYSKVPWNNIIGMRNRLIHGYYDIDLDIVWQTVQEDIPFLLKTLQEIITN